MLFQKALGSYIAERLRISIGLDIRSQPDVNRALSRLGSVNGALGTMDLSSASDRNSMAMVEFLFPPEIVGWIRAFRSPTCQLPDGTEVKMEMCSSMGNGFTFPLQTALFAAVTITALRLMGYRISRPHWPIEAQTWGVFGDDIIVRREAFDYIAKQLTKLGHVINENKSFQSGPFRESCGTDWYDGFNVRSVYVRRLDSISALYSAINRLSRWASTWTPLPKTMSLLMGALPAKSRAMYIPPHEDDSSGLKCALEDLPENWGIDHPRKVRRTAQENNLYSYKALTPKRAELSCDYLEQRSSPEAILVSALGGYVSTPGTSFLLGATPTAGIRSRIVTWKVSWRYTSSW